MAATTPATADSATRLGAGRPVRIPREPAAPTFTSGIHHPAIIARSLIGAIALPILLLPSRQRRAQHGCTPSKKSIRHGG
jgi:hypothetical protein